jgi:hypothetical protein
MMHLFLMEFAVVSTQFWKTRSHVFTSLILFEMQAHSPGLMDILEEWSLHITISSLGEK